MHAWVLTFQYRYTRVHAHSICNTCIQLYIYVCVYIYAPMYAYQQFDCLRLSPAKPELTTAALHRTSVHVWSGSAMWSDGSIHAYIYSNHSKMQGIHEAPHIYIYMHAKGNIFFFKFFFQAESCVLYKYICLTRHCTQCMYDWCSAMAMQIHSGVVIYTPVT
jgi:hypothetical protein